MKVAIHQPSYAPWCGYFSKLSYADAFVFLDDAQMTKNNLVNRNKIWSNGQERWLTVPASFSLGDAIRETRFADPAWGRRHRALLEGSYRKAPHFKEVMALLDPLLEGPFDDLAELNIQMTRTIAGYLGIHRTYHRSSDLHCPGKADDRLIEILLELGADTYVSGPGGLLYQDMDKFAANNLSVEIKSYTPIPYPQFSEPFLPRLSVLDALFHLGREASDVTRYVEQEAERAAH